MERRSPPKSRRLSDNALVVLRARYLRRDEERRLIETPEELFRRVATAVASAEGRWGGADRVARARGEFEELLASLEFLPNSPTLMNAGTRLGQLSACFVLPVEDTMEGIFETVKHTALVQRTGGGTGFSFSKLRRRGDLVASTGGEASGPVSFMRIFDAVTENIRQGGKRRGANMGVLHVEHPDVREFIRAKLEEPALRNFNISVAATDAFMQAVRDGRAHVLYDPRTGRPAGELDARELFEEIVECAWTTGDPGLLFVDAINRDNPTPHLGVMEATNPCGELPLLPNESCNLGSINLARMLRSGPDGGATVDWEAIRRTTRKAIRFLDDVVEVSQAPTPEIARMTRNNRKLGLGVMGFAEMLVRLGSSYDSDAAVRLASDLMRQIAAEALSTSRELAEERGVFPSWRGSRHEERGLRLRNATCTAIAPTGTISIIADTTASIEPMFALAYRRTHVLKGETLPEVSPVLREVLSRRGLDVRRIMEEVSVRGRLGEVPGIPEDLVRLFVTALEIPMERHLQMQAAFQEHVDNSVSKTVNLPHEATVAEVQGAYWRAWELGLKGITIFRYGSKSAQVLELGVGEEPWEIDHGTKCDPNECRV
ncbi:MAG: adenosylcobalamin-dependent ribonucleoside-diphosphate reductase [Deltaproteobacteria bacterium]|nr:adenosylcobalamin-dependent ribonucleoside-diphosphate reductase [Deltaproteobacteria bacterium]